jgi:membrane protein required for colicin V production
MGLSDLTQFDVIVFILLAISAAVGFVRGAIREVFALVALFAAAGVAVFGLPAYAPMFRAVVHPAWLGTVAGLLVVFGATYVLLRLVGAGLARQVRGANVLSSLDRSLGLLIGLVRGLLVLGALYLMFNAATPQDLQPRWITGSTTWPLARNMGRVLEAAAPRGLDVAGRLRPAFERAVKDGSGDRSVTDGYEAPARGGTDDLERAR